MVWLGRARLGMARVFNRQYKETSMRVLNPKVGNRPLDKEYIPVIDALNDIGVKTLSSCCGHGKTNGYIDIDIPKNSLFSDTMD
jgi:hypothetical protein